MQSAKSIKGTGLIQHVKFFISLTKPRIFFAIAFTAWIGLFLQEAYFLYSVWVDLALILSTVMASAGGAVLNHYFERETDALMERTKNRPLVNSDRSTQVKALLWAAFLGVGGHLLCGFALGWTSSFWLFLGYLNYVLFYTLWFKHNSLWNVTVGSFSSSFAVLAGDTALTGSITTNGVILAVLLFFWNPAHFWNLTALYAKDYQSAKIPMLSNLIGRPDTVVMILVHVVLVILSAFALHRYGSLGLVYLVGCSITSLILLVWNAQILFELSDRLFRRNFIYSNIYLILIYVAIILDRFFPVSF